MTRNVYRLPNDIYNRKYDRQISEEEVRKTLVGEKSTQEPCDDKISRQAVMEVIKKCHCEEWVKAEIGASIEALPPIQEAQE